MSTDSPLPPIPYRFCDVLLTLSASREVLRRFDQLYAAFREPVATADPEGARCLIDTDESGRGEVVIDGERRRLRMADPESAYAITLVLDAVAAASRTHLFLHASAACAGDRTALFVGPSGSGKSTLAEALVAAGTERLADDVAPIGIADGTLAPFPRSEPAGSHGSPEHSRTPQHVFLLAPPVAPARLHIAVDRVPDEWEDMPPWGEAGSVVVRRRADHDEIVGEAIEPQALEAVSRACREAGVLVLGDFGRAAAGFAEKPVVRPLAPATGLPLVAAHLFGRGARDVSRLIWDLGSALAHADLWELTVGPPADTARAVLDLLGGRPLARR